MPTTSDDASVTLSNVSDRSRDERSTDTTTDNNISHEQVTRVASSASNHANGLSDLITPAPALASSRYNRQMLIPSISVGGQDRISRAKVLVVGLGGLGSPAALYLAGAGVGTLGLLDNDYVEVTNLHRQIVHREFSVQQAMTKVESAFRGCRELNSEIEIIQHPIRLDVSDRASAEDVLNIVDQYDIVLDCTDNPATRYLVNDLCVLHGKTLVSGAAQRLEGQVLVLNYLLHDSQERGPCYRCVFPSPPSPDMVKGCGEIGILGPVVGTIGTLMATETLRLIVKGENEARKPSMLLYNAWPQDPRSMFRTIGLRGKRPDCIACGEAEALKSLNKDKITRQNISDGRMDYVAFCGVSQQVLLEKKERIGATEFMNIIRSNSQASGAETSPRTLVIDVREPFEIEMGTKINVGINIPISTILRSKDLPDRLKSSIMESSNDTLVFVCQRGNDSQVAAKRLIEWRSKTQQQDVAQNQKHTSTRSDASDIFVGDVAGGLEAIERLVINDTF